MTNTKPASERLCLPLVHWPTADQLAWTAAQDVDDIFGRTGRAANWSSSSKSNFIGRYGRWLGWVYRVDADLMTAPPVDRVTRTRVLDYIKQLNASIRSEVTVHAYVRSLLTAMLTFAPDADWHWLKVVEANLRKKMRPAVDKRHQVRPTRDLFALGLSLMDGASTATAMGTIGRAIMFRDGLLTAIFASRTPRRGTVAMMEIGKHLVREGQLYWLAFGENDMKGGRFSEKYLPDILTPYVTTYLNLHRAVLCRSRERELSTRAVWIGEHGRPIQGPGIRSAIVSRTFPKFGVAISPHRFRDSLATSFAYEDPANLPAAGLVLDHATPSMVNRHYNQARAHRSLQRVHGNLEDLRRELRPAYDRQRSGADDTGI